MGDALRVCIRPISTQKLLLKLKRLILQFPGQFERWFMIVVRYRAAPFYWSYISVRQDYECTRDELKSRFRGSNALTQSRRVPPKYKSRPCPKGTRFERLTSIVVKKGRRKETQWKCFKRKPTRILSWQQNNQKCWESRWSITMGFDTNATLMSPFLNYSPNMVRPVGQSSVITFLFEDPSNRRDS